MALIAVLLLLVFILTIVGGLFYRHQIQIEKVSRSLLREQALLLLMSAENWSREVLRVDASESTTDHLKEAWNRGLPPMSIEGATVTGCLSDLQARFNINSLAWYTNKSWEVEQESDLKSGNTTTRRRIARRLFAGLGLDDSDARIASLVDWLDADGWLTSAESAEDDEYLLMDPPYRAANQPLVEISELVLVRGFSNTDVVRIEPWVNLLPDFVPVNVNTASPTVLMALSPSITSAVAEHLVESRPFADETDFFETLAATAGERETSLRDLLPGTFISVQSEYFSLSALIELAGTRLQYHSVIHRRGQDSQVYTRSLSFLPKLQSIDNDPGIRNFCRQPEPTELHT